MEKNKSFIKLIMLVLLGDQTNEYCIMEVFEYLFYVSSFRLLGTIITSFSQSKAK